MYFSNFEEYLNQLNDIFANNYKSSLFIIGTFSSFVLLRDNHISQFMDT